MWNKHLKNIVALACIAPAVFMASCEKVDHSGERQTRQNQPWVSQDDVARMLSEIDIGTDQVTEVHDAVTSSTGNGYDEEYTMMDLFREPGSGVGDAESKALGLQVDVKSYSSPLKDLITDYIETHGAPATKSSSGGDFTPEEYLAALQSSDIQIYWPYSGEWDGKTEPIITFDPEDGSAVNVGYQKMEDGSVRTVNVTEDMAKNGPVWVVNRNDDSYFESLEMLRRRDPDWGSSGGELVVGSCGTEAVPDGTAPVKTLILKSITAKRNYDSWFAGASEFFVKCGSIENFTASTEAEMKLYSPEVTDFMIVVRRNEVGKEKDFNAILVSDWTSQLESVAFMAVEDDGGTRTEWKCSGYVKIKSRSYGFEVSLPLNVRDDIVWRGQLSSSYIERYNNTRGHFGDMDLTFQIVEK
jgi:hypothetical protein